jgi:hypothetical protein
VRHTLATQCISRGTSLEAIAALLGHRSARMTLVYGRVLDIGRGAGVPAGRFMIEAGLDAVGLDIGFGRGCGCRRARPSSLCLSRQMTMPSTVTGTQELLVAPFPSCPL